ncbi:MAG: RNA-binding S4 domain-containing protein [Bacteroidetes bacterium]|nr:RNA-binding S4 domain-containing protein [Bacteroidota bacterium]
MEKFRIEGDHIELIQLLKVIGLADTGGQAKVMVEEGLVKVNGEVELRKRAKLRAGDRVQVGEEIYAME